MKNMVGLLFLYTKSLLKLTLTSLIAFGWIDSESGVAELSDIQYEPALLCETGRGVAQPGKGIGMVS